MTRTLGLALVLLGVLGPPSARAQPGPGCAEPIVQWASACVVAGEPARAASCPAGRAMFTVGSGGLLVEVTRSPETAFVALGELGASPVGEFADWNLAPALDRDAFEALVGCVRERPDALAGALDATPEAPHAGGTGGAHGALASAPSARAGPGALPWRAALGLTIALALLVRRFGARGLTTRALAPLALGAATFAARRLLVPEGYFHQNGHGPGWIAYALGREAAYGPGYEQLFGWAAARAHDPDGAVFLVQGALAALVPAAAFAIARGVAAPREVAWACALAVALSPIEARLAQSESYFAAQGSLLVLATAVLATTVHDGAVARERILGAVASGLLVAQAARVHPVAWLAAALVPGVVALAPGATATRLRWATMAAGVVGLVVLAVAGPDMLGVLRGELGTAWLGPARHADNRVMPEWLLTTLTLTLALLVLAARSARYRRLALAGALLGLTLAVAWRGNLLGAAPAWVHHAYVWLYLGPFVAAVSGLVPQGPAEAPAWLVTRRAHATLAAAMALAAVAGYATTLGQTLARSTDAREAALVRIWREHLPVGAVVVHLERAGRQILSLPLHAFHDVPLMVEEPPPDLTTLGADVFVYRSGLCTTERGRAYCDALESSYVLQPFATAVLPAAPSMEGLDYDRPMVEVGLYSVRDRR